MLPMRDYGGLLLSMTFVIVAFAASSAGESSTTEFADIELYFTDEGAGEYYVLIPIPPTDMRHTVTDSHNPAILINESNHTPTVPGMLSSIGVLCRASLHPERRFQSADCRTERFPFQQRVPPNQ